MNCKHSFQEKSMGQAYYLNVQGGDVPDFSHFGHFLLNFICQSYWREDGERSILQANYKPSEFGLGCEIMCLPIVPRPPIFILPNRKNGTESVVTVFGTTSRMTMTFSGFDGMSLEAILEPL